MLTNLLAEQESASLIEIFGGQQWLLENGIVSEPAIDTLLGYAYMQPGVRNVKVQIDLDEKNDGKVPTVKYQVQLSLWPSSRLKLLNRFMKGENTIFNKLAALALMRVFRFEPSTYIENTTIRFAKSFLPKKYAVTVDVK